MLKVVLHCGTGRISAWAHQNLVQYANGTQERDLYAIGYPDVYGHVIFRSRCFADLSTNICTVSTVLSVCISAFAELMLLVQGIFE